MKLSFMRDLSVVSVSHALAGLLAMAYTMSVSRLLGVAEYGYFQSMMAIYSTLTVFVGPMGLSTVHCVAVAGDTSRPFVVGKFLRFALGVGGVCTVGLVCLSPWLAGVLEGGIFPIVAVGVLVTATAALAVFYGALQAHGAYTWYGMSKIAEALVGLGAGLLLVRSGAGTSGAVLGYVVGMTSLLLYFLAHRRLYSFRGSAFSAWKELRTLVRISLVHGIVFLVSDVPVVLARSRLSAEASGLYGALYNLRQLVLPFCLASVAPLYSRTVSSTSGRKTLYQVLVLVSGLGGAFLSAGMFFPQLPLRLIYGASFVGASRYMAFYGIALLLQMISIVVMFYRVARKQVSLVRLLMPVVVVVVGIMLPDPTIPKLIAIQIVAWISYLASVSCRWMISLWLERTVVDGTTHTGDHAGV
jgi:O-antigen/teichoic acid export membrane protein